MNLSNKELLDQVNKAGIWFRAYKTKCLWAKEIDSEQTIETLEGSVSASVGDYLCRGDANEVWPQKASSLFTKYEATTETDSEGWQEFSPKPDAAGVMAAEIEHSFKVNASWGELAGKPGDYLVKNETERDVEYPEDVWIVSKSIFEGTYEAE